MKAMKAVKSATRLKGEMGLILRDTLGSAKQPAAGADVSAMPLRQLPSYLRRR